MGLANISECYNLCCSNLREEIVLKQAQCELTAQGNGIHRLQNPSPEMMQQDGESEELLTAGQIAIEV